VFLPIVFAKGLIMRSLRFFGVCLALMFMLSACSSSELFVSKPPDRTEPLSMPRYPNAYDEQYRSRVSFTNFDDQFLEFSTDDSVDEVSAFYQTYFEKHQWKNIVSGSVDNPNSDSYGAYAVHASNEDACPIYDFYSTIKEVDESETYVETKLISLTCLLR
jgi:hypothetical protein